MMKRLNNSQYHALRDLDRQVHGALTTAFVGDEEGPRARLLTLAAELRKAAERAERIAKMRERKPAVL